MIRRQGEREKGRKGEREKGRKGKGRRGEKEKRRKGEMEREKCMRMFLNMYHADGNGVYDDRRFAEGELSKVVAF